MPEPTATNSKRELLTTLAVLVAIVVIVAGVIAFNRRGKEQDNGTDTPQTTLNQTGSEPSTGTGDEAVPDGNYKDGAYQATGDYSTPGGRETISVDLTLKDGVVSDSDVQGSGGSDNARIHQQEFEDGYKQYVVGKPISDINLSRVSGSSLTSQGFNDALAKIADQART